MKRVLPIMLATGVMFSTVFTATAGASELAPEEMKTQIETLTSEKEELEKRVSELESENEALKNESQEPEEVKTETVGTVYTDKTVVNYRLLEDDYVTIYGKANGVYSYEAVSGATITIPWIQADMIDLQ